MYVGNTPDDFLHDAVLCRRNTTLNGLGNEFLITCVQPVRGQYLTVRYDTLIQIQRGNSQWRAIGWYSHVQGSATDLEDSMHVLN